MGEILSFADRNFYNDWWNSDDIVTFWKTWNLPVHRWAVRHLYKPLLNSGVSAKNASFVVFFISAALHEYLVSVPLRMFKYYAFAGMLCQVIFFDSTWLSLTYWIISDSIWLILTFWIISDSVELIWIGVTQFDLIWLSLTWFDSFWLTLTHWIIYDSIWLSLTQFDTVWYIDSLLQFEVK